MVLSGIAIDWFTEVEAKSTTSWDALKKAFEDEFKFLWDDNNIATKIYNTKQCKHENVRACNCRLKELLVKLENQSVDRLQKRWFLEGLIP